MVGELDGKKEWRLAGNGKEGRDSFSYATCDITRIYWPAWIVQWRRRAMNKRMETLKFAEQQ